jgi:uncharacterized protein YndB with AHSA1/START domain
MALDTLSGFVKAPPAAVFNYIADVKRHVEWSGSVDLGLDRIEVLTDGPIGKGTRFRSAGRNITSNLNRDESEVTEFEPGRRFGFETNFELNGAKATFTHRYEVSPEKDGTRLVYTMVGAKPHNAKALLLMAVLLTIQRPTAKKVTRSGFDALLKKLDEVMADQQPQSETAPAG